MSKNLIVAATKFEIAPVLESLDMLSLFESDQGASWREGPKDVDVLITGVGQMQAAYHLGALLARENYSAALNFGIAGSFRKELPKGGLVRVVQEELADLGAEDAKQNLDLFEMGLLDRNLAPFIDGALRAPELTLDSLSSIPRVKSITVNRVLGTEKSIEDATLRYNPEIVNMEGAAFLYACSANNLPCASIRAISDHVGPRDKREWDIPGAIKALAKKALEIVDELMQRT